MGFVSVFKVRASCCIVQYTENTGRCGGFMSQCLYCAPFTENTVRNNATVRAAAASVVVVAAKSAAAAAVAAAAAADSGGGGLQSQSMSCGQTGLRFPEPSACCQTRRVEFKLNSNLACWRVATPSVNSGQTGCDRRSPCANTASTERCGQRTARPRSSTG